MLVVRPFSCLLACTAMCLTTAHGVEPGARTLADVKAKIHAGLNALKSVQFTQTISEKTQFQDMILSSESEVKVAFKKLDKTGYASRIEIERKELNTIDGEERKSETYQLLICDGRHNYRLERQNGRTQATRSRFNSAEAISPFDAKAIFDRLERVQTLRLLPDETINGREALVIEARTRELPESVDLGKTVTWYDQETGIELKSVTHNRRNQVVRTAVTTACKINGEIPDEQFTLDVPSGVEVLDLDAARDRRNLQEPGEEDGEQDTP